MFGGVYYMAWGATIIRDTIMTGRTIERVREFAKGVWYTLCFIISFYREESILSIFIGIEKLYYK